MLESPAEEDCCRDMECHPPDRKGAGARGWSQVVVSLYIYIYIIIFLFIIYIYIVGLTSMHNKGTLGCSYVINFVVGFAAACPEHLAEERRGALNRCQ